MGIRSLVLLMLLNSLTYIGPVYAFRWVGYAPSHPWQPGQIADSALVWQDLETLYAYGFRGVVTYGTLDSLCRVPRYARAIGFDSIIMGIWIDTDMTVNRQQIEWALRTHGPADKLCVGNEALFFGRCSLAYLQWAMDTVRISTGKPVTTAEHWTMYHHPRYRNWLLQNCDFLFPIMNPTNEGITSPRAAALWVKARFDSIATLAGDSLSVLVKEAGWPTGSRDSAHWSWANQFCQDTFFCLLDSIGDTNQLRFCNFEAFDGLWKNWGPEESCFGLFTSDRQPKLFAQRLGQVVGEKESQGYRSSVPHQSFISDARLLNSAEPLTIFAITGQKVLDIAAGTCLHLAPGLYFVCPTKPDGPARWKLVVIR
ncbi:MAG: hypothetical protein ABIK44_00480 [candidate division WOR-3 bacterium]